MSETSVVNVVASSETLTRLGTGDTKTNINVKLTSPAGNRTLRVTLTEFQPGIGVPTSLMLFGNEEDGNEIQETLTNIQDDTPQDTTNQFYYLGTIYTSSGTIFDFEIEFLTGDGASATIPVPWKLSPFNITYIVEETGGGVSAELEVTPDDVENSTDIDWLTIETVPSGNTVRGVLDINARAMRIQLDSGGASDATATMKLLWGQNR